MAKRTQTSRNTRSSPVDPIIPLAAQLLKLWDAENANSGSNEPPTAEFDQWRRGIGSVISFTRACSLDGALVQLVLAVEQIDDATAIYEDRQDGNLLHTLSEADRLLRSAVRAMRALVDDPAKSLAEIYAAHLCWVVDNVDELAEQGAVIRHKEMASADMK